MVRTLMLARGLSMSALARQVNRHISTVSLVVSGKVRNVQVENGIARALGVRRETLWAK